MLLTTLTVTGTPSFMRSSGPGEVPLYPMVLMMRLGASSTVTGAISQREIGLRHVRRSRRAPERIASALLAHQPAARGRQPGNLEKVASLHRPRPCYRSQGSSPTISIQ